MSKTNNIKAVRQLLDGTHKSQTKTEIIVSDTKAEIQRKVGETWKDSKGVEWEQRSGFKIQKGKMDELRRKLQLTLPKNCPKCQKTLTSKLDFKFMKLENHCFDCQVSMEHNLKIEGKFEEYEQERMRKNAVTWLINAEQEVLELAKLFKENKISTGDGNSELWISELTPEQIEEKILSDFRTFKTKFMQDWNITLD